MNPFGFIFAIGLLLAVGMFARGLVARRHRKELEGREYRYFRNEIHRIENQLKQLRREKGKEITHEALYAIIAEECSAIKRNPKRGIELREDVPDIMEEGNYPELVKLYCDLVCLKKHEP